MDRLLITGFKDDEESKDDEEKSCWIRYVRYPRVQMVREPEN